MMPIMNELAVSPISEKGNSLTKNTKIFGKENSFLEFFGVSKKETKKNKKEPKEVNLLNQVPQFNFNQNLTRKASETSEVKSGQNLTKVNEKVKVEPKLSSPLNSPKIESVMVLGKRIESTETSNLSKTENLSSKVMAPKTMEAKDLNSKVVVPKTELNSLKKDGAINDGLKLKENSIQTEIKISKDLTPQWKGRGMSQINDLNLQNSARSQNTKMDLKGLNSDIKSADNSKNTQTVTNYGLKKLNGVEKTEGILGEKKIEKSSKTDDSTNALQGLVLNKKIEPSNVAVSKTIDEKPMEFHNVLQQVENGIKINYNNQLKEMKIKLQPEELGEVEVKLTIENNIMKADFVVESQQVKEILESKFDTLKNALHDKGFEGAQINVSVSTNGKKEGESRERFDFENRKTVGKGRDDFDLTKVATIDSSSKINRAGNSSNIDIVV